MDSFYIRYMPVFVSLLLLTGFVHADVLPQQPDEVQDLRVVTSVFVIGNFHQDSALQWDLSSEYLGVNLVIENPFQPLVVEPEPPLNFRESQMHCTYVEDSSAINGKISFDKIGIVDSRAKSGQDWNVENTRLITFIGYNAGSVLSTEELTMNNVGTTFPTAFTVKCPFAGDEEGCICTPAFCNKVAAGSAINLDTFSLMTAANLHNVNKKGDPGFFPPIPSDNGPALLSYQLEVTGYQSDKPANGLISTHTEGSLREGGRSGIDGENPYSLYMSAEFSDRSEIIGKTTLFDKSIEYESGFF